jgi:hypothetical protein
MIIRGILSISWVHWRNRLFAVLTSDLPVIHQILYERAICECAVAASPAGLFSPRRTLQQKNDGICRVQKRDVTFFNGFCTSICRVRILRGFVESNESGLRGGQALRRQPQIVHIVNGERTKHDRRVQQSLLSNRTYRELTLDLCAKKSVAAAERKVVQQNI